MGAPVPPASGLCGELIAGRPRIRADQPRPTVGARPAPTSRCASVHAPTHSRTEPSSLRIGVARITATFCAQAVARGELVALLPQWQCAPLKIYALLPGRKLVPAKVRAFLDLVEQEEKGVL